MKARNAICGAILALFALFAMSVQAGDKTTTSNNTSSSSSSDPVDCSRDSFTITSAAPTGTAMMSTGPINSTACVGVRSTPNNVESITADNPNLGYAGDGLLNGEGGWLSGTQFLNSSQSLLDLNPATAGQSIDPGWVQLGRLYGNSGTMTTSSVYPAGGSAFDLSQVLSYVQTETVQPSTPKGGIGGNWTLTVNADIANIFHNAGLFSRSTFDELAFQVKAGDKWAVYAFNFTELTGFDLNTPYTLSGTWNLNDFRNSSGNSDQDISGLTLWARDPLSQEAEVPEPGALALMGVGLAALVALRRRRSV